MEKLNRSELINIVSVYTAQAKQFAEWANEAASDGESGAARLWKMREEQATAIAQKFQRVLDNHNKRIAVSDNVWD